MAKDSRSWLTRLLFAQGKEPDPRFTLANERTFLAWIRTSLAFLAAGIAAFALDGMAGGDDARWRLLALLMPLIAGALTIFALLRWVGVERAMRLNRPLLAPAGIPFLVFLVLVFSVVIFSLAVV